MLGLNELMKTKPFLYFLHCLILTFMRFLWDGCEKYFVLRMNGNICLHGSSRVSLFALKSPRLRAGLSFLLSFALLPLCAQAGQLTQLQLSDPIVASRGPHSTIWERTYNRRPVRRGRRSRRRDTTPKSRRALTDGAPPMVN